MASRVEQFRALVQAQPENELFQFTLAQALIAEGKGAEAVPHLEFCAAKKSDWMMPRILLGKQLLALGHKPYARTVLEQAWHLALEQHHEDPEREIRALLADLQ